MNIIYLFILLTLLILIIFFRKAIIHIQERKKDKLNERRLLKLLNVTSIIDLNENINERTENYFPWQDVMKCPIARFNESIIIVDFRSPPETWQNMVGRAGELTICRKTKTQINFRITCMN